MKLLVFTILLCVGLTAHGDEPKVTGIFSSMSFGTEDVTGAEVFIVYSESGYYALVQCAEGAISRPIVTPARVSGNLVEFTVPKPAHQTDYTCPAGKFTGKILKDKLEGHFSGTDWPGVLMRRQSYWQ